jgi:hypothetical protein
MITLLTALGGLLWWVLYSSIFALFFALIAYAVLRWTERGGVLFNRVYLACLLWNLIGIALIFAVASIEGRLHPPYAPLLASGLLRVVLVLNMLIGTLLLWRLTPRLDARRIRPGSACMAVAAIMAIGFGVATSLA